MQTAMQYKLMIFCRLHELLNNTRAPKTSGCWAPMALACKQAQKVNNVLKVFEGYPSNKSCKRDCSTTI